MAYRTKGMGDDSTTPPNYAGCDAWYSRLLNYPYCQTLEAVQAAGRPAIYGTSFPQPPMPPTVKGTLPDGSPIPVVPASGTDAQATVDAILAKQYADWQAQNQQFFQDVNQANAGINWWLIGGIAAAGVFAFASLGGGSPRRYGR